MGNLKYIDDELAAKFLAGEATPDEAIQVNEWIEYSSENRMRFKELESIWNLNNKNPHFSPPKSSAWNSIEPSLVKKKSQVRFLTPYRIAASILLIAALSVGLYFFRSDVTSPQLAWNLKQTNNEIASLNLSDGTSVTIEPEQ
ncbi:MAG: hypothetical protein QM734_09800 [Cyclobacteriaceae bacterium]